MEKTAEKKEISWNSVDDCLPAALKKVIAFYRNSHGKGRRVMAVYIPPVTVDAANFYSEYVDDYEYDTLNGDEVEYVKAGWFESVENHDEYGYLTIDDRVTYWRFLADVDPEMVEE